MRTLVTLIFCALLFSVPALADDGCGDMFCTIDKDRDGQVSRKEFLGSEVKVDRQKAVKLFPDMRDAEQMSEGQLKEKLFERMDRNNDGLLNRDEWIRVAPNILEINF